MKNRILLFNQKTEECIGCDTVPVARSVVRKWVYEGMHFGSLDILEAPINVRWYLQSVVCQESLVTCDICGKESKGKHINFIEDEHGICLFTKCHTCRDGNY